MPSAVPKLAHRAHEKIAPSVLLVGLRRLVCQRPARLAKGIFHQVDAEVTWRRSSTPSFYDTLNDLECLKNSNVIVSIRERSEARSTQR
ncbi:MAG: hypothetical protein ABL973_09315 [Micropepsaceae bacterium]